MDKVLSDLRRIAQTYPVRGVQDAVIAAVDEVQRLRAQLAAARAALAAVSERIDRGYYHTAKALIDAALAGEARHDK